MLPAPCSGSPPALRGTSPPPAATPAAAPPRGPPTTAARGASRPAAHGWWLGPDVPRGPATGGALGNMATSQKRMAKMVKNLEMRWNMIKWSVKNIELQAWKYCSIFLDLFGRTIWWHLWAFFFTWRVGKMMQNDDSWGGWWFGGKKMLEALKWSMARMIRTKRPVGPLSCPSASKWWKGV